MHGIMGEDRSDVETLVVLLRRLKNDDRLRVRTKGYSGSGDLLNKGARQLSAFAVAGCTRFIVHHDADDKDPATIHETVLQKVVKPAGIPSGCCIVVPVREIEAWILADIEAVTHIFNSWRPSPIPSPEKVEHPKELIERLSRAGNTRPRCVHKIHNPKVASHLDPETLLKKCDSFKPFYDFVTTH